MGTSTFFAKKYLSPLRKRFGAWLERKALDAPEFTCAMHSAGLCRLSAERFRTLF
jgi:hypothetical protein